MELPLLIQMFPSLSSRIPSHWSARKPSATVIFFITLSPSTIDIPFEVAISIFPSFVSRKALHLSERSFRATVNFFILLEAGSQHHAPLPFVPNHIRLLRSLYRMSTSMPSNWLHG